MKSLLISGMYYPPQVGGISELMSSLAKTLGRDRVCCLTGVPQSDVTVTDVDAPRVYRCPSAFAQSRRTKALGWAWALPRIVIQERPEVIMLATIDDGNLGLLLNQWLKLPLIVFAHGNEILDVLVERWPKPLRALQSANRVITVSRYTASLVERAGVDPNRVEVIHPGLDPGRFRPLPSNSELRKRLLQDRHRDRVILTVGNLVARKGQDTTIRALPGLLRRVPDVSYLIVGEGPHRNQLESLALELGVREHVVFAGSLPNEDVAQIYALCDVFVMPSRSEWDKNDVEGFGIVYLEASACGKPVIGAWSGGVPEAVVHEATGLLVDPMSPDELSRALERLLKDQELANRLGEQGRQRAVQEFTWTEVAERVQRTLESVKLE